MRRSKKAKLPIQLHYESLHTACGKMLENAFTGRNAEKVASSHHFVSELGAWLIALNSRRENVILELATQEYQYSLLALTQGHYRHAFKGLRLVLELTMQLVYLSTQEVALREWLQSKKDTIWSVLIDNENGIFSARFSHSFFPDLEQDIPYHGALAIQVYRECSECVHGNIQKHIPLPKALEFSQESFELWHIKSAVISLIVHFILTMRYLKEISNDDIAKLEPILLARLGHIQNIRIVFGGPK